MELSNWGLLAAIAASALLSIAALFVMLSLRVRVSGLAEHVRELRDLRISLQQMETEQSRLFDALTAISTRPGEHDQLLVALQEMKAEQRHLGKMLSEISEIVLRWDVSVQRVSSELDNFLRSEDVAQLGHVADGGTVSGTSA
jgi:hypothetical protein